MREREKDNIWKMEQIRLIRGYANRGLVYLRKNFWWLLFCIAECFPRLQAIQKRQQYNYLSHSADILNSRDMETILIARTDCDVQATITFIV